jgi:peptidylprolyl isomerase
MAMRATGHSPAKKAAKKPAPKKRPVAKAAPRKPVKKAAAAKKAAVKKPAAKPAPKAATKPAAKQPAAKPAAKKPEPMKKTPSKATEKPAAEKSAKPAAKPAAEKPAKPAAKPAAEKPAKPAAKPAPKKRPPGDPENQLYMELTGGRVVIDLKPDLAPGHVARIKELVREKYYDGLVFHRVIEGFMAQTGDPRGDGTGGSGTKLKAEFSEAPHERGTVSMARAANPDSGDSQFFICFAPARFLDRQYTVWGKVSSGMQYVDQIKKGDRTQNGTVRDPDRIITLRVGADVEE